MAGMRDVANVLDRSRSSNALPRRAARGEARRQVVYELISGLSGLALVVFMWGHMVFVASILLGTRGFDWIATAMEDYWIAQPTVVGVLILLLIHAVFAGRKVPAQLRERRRFFALAKELRASGKAWSGGEGRDRPHIDSWLWIWQVRTAVVILVFGSFHLVLMMLNIFSGVLDSRGGVAGIQADISMERTQAGLGWMYLVLLICVEFHAGVGLYRLAVKWGVLSRLPRAALARIEQFLYWALIGLGLVVLAVLAGLIPPPLGFLTQARP
jgi:fumarate reductase subunit C